MLYRRYFCICSLLALLAVVLLFSITATVRRRKLRVIPQTIHYQPRISAVFEWGQVKVDNGSSDATTAPTQETTPGPWRYTKVSDVVKNHSTAIADEMKGHVFLDPERTKLADYIPALGGRPLSYFILSTWETRSPMLGDIINTLPGNFHFFEPLSSYGVVQLNETVAKQAIDSEVKHLMNCRFSRAPKYMKELSVNRPSVRKNTRLWSACKVQRDLCVSVEFLHAFCRQSPIKTMSLIRVRLRDMTSVLEDKKMDARIILLVRDPRAVMQSRDNKKWCRREPDCYDPARLCQFMMDDYNAYRELVKAYPGRVTVLRMEDLALDTFGETAKLLDFLRAPFTEKTHDFLQANTISSTDSNVNQLRDSPFAWLQSTRMTWEKLEGIQRECLNVTTAWGYRVATNESLVDPQFIPLTELRLPDNWIVDCAGGSVIPKDYSSIFNKVLKDNGLFLVFLSVLQLRDHNEDNDYNNRECRRKGTYM